MEVEQNYELPLHLNCLAPGTTQDANGLRKTVIMYDAYIEWDSILNIEEFVKFDLFSEEEREKEKTIIVTKVRQEFVIYANANQIAHMWGMYKVWKAKRSIILNTFSKN